MTAADQMPSESDGARRKTLRTRSNPKPGRDAVLTLKKDNLLVASLPLASNAPLTVCIYYVPDRLIAEAALTTDYFKLLAQQPWPGVEELAHAVIDDFNNELIPRWISIRITAHLDAEFSVYMEDRQPLWDNPALLLRVPAD